MRSVTTQTVSIKAEFDKAFDYIANPFNQKEWAINFIKDIKQTDGGLIAQTPFGETPLHFQSEKKTGIIDIYMGNGNPTCTRLIKNEEGCEYLFTLLKPKDMPDVVWENQGIPGLIEELATLKSILEN